MPKPKHQSRETKKFVSRQRRQLAVRDRSPDVNASEEQVLIRR